MISPHFFTIQCRDTHGQTLYLTPEGSWSPHPSDAATFTDPHSADAAARANIRQRHAAPAGFDTSQAITADPSPDL